MNTGAVILAAGHRSSASGFRPMLPVGDTTAIKRIIITLQQAGIEPIVVITGDQGKELEKHVSKMRVICLRNDDYENTQMFDSICKGLTYIEDLCDRVLVMPVKVPLFLEESVDKLLGSDAPVVCPVYEGRRGHPVLIRKAWIGRILQYDGGRGLRGALREPDIDGLVEEIPVDDQGIIMAVETDEDCARAMEQIRHKKIPMHPKIQLYLERDEVFFGPGIAQFLMLISHTGSMQTACTQMNMSYTKGWKIMKTAEKELGYPLLITQAGGPEGGFSQLTPKAEVFLDKFLKMEQELKQEMERLYQYYYENKGELS